MKQIVRNNIYISDTDADLKWKLELSYLTLNIFKHFFLKLVDVITKCSFTDDNIFVATISDSFPFLWN